MMSHEAWIMISGISMANLIALIGGFMHLATRLARIETDLTWIKKNGIKCPLNLENRSN